MPKCPNCAQSTRRTEDWACQWCGYPLLSGGYKKTSKTYKQFKDEQSSERQPPVTEETTISTQPVAGPVTPVEEPVPASEPGPPADDEPVTETIVEQVLPVESPPAPEIITEPELPADTAPEQEIVIEEGPQTETEPIPEVIVAPAPPDAVQPGPETATAPASGEVGISVEELLAAYDTEGEAANTRFFDNILNITGVVDRIEVKDATDVCFITLASAEKKRLQTVRCIFSKEKGTELNLLVPGQTATVRGKYDGTIIDIRMSDCTLVK